MRCLCQNIKDFIKWSVYIVRFFEVFDMYIFMAAQIFCCENKYFEI